MARIGRGIKAFGKLINSFGTLMWRIVTFPFILFWRGCCAVGRGIKAVYRAIIATPGNTIRGLIRFGKWLYHTALMIRTKVEYLQTESQKWKVFFTTLKAPYSLLRMCGFSPQMALTFLTVGTVAGGAVGVTEVLADKSFSNGDPGVYTAPLDAPVEYSEEFNTLRLDLGTTSVGSIDISDITLGSAYANSALPSGETNVVIVGGLPTVSDPAFTETFLEVGHLIFEKSRCTKLILTNIETHTLNIVGNASDGQSISAVAGTPRMRGIGGGNRADDMSTRAGYYDQLKITSASSAINGKVDVLRLSNLYTKGGPCVLDRIKAGTIDILYNEIGNGDGFALKDFTVATTVIYKTFNNEENVEVSIAPPS